MKEEARMPLGIRVRHSRLHTLLLRILESQPTASTAMLDLLSQTLEQGQSVFNAATASIREIKRNWGIT